MWSTTNDGGWWSVVMVATTLFSRRRWFAGVSVSQSIDRRLKWDSEDVDQGEVSPP